MKRRATIALTLMLVLVAALGVGIGIGRHRKSTRVSVGPSDTQAPSVSVTADSTTAPPDSSASPTSTASSSAAPEAPPRTTTSRYVFPVSAGSASYGRSHHDYPAADVFAPCGTPVVAPTSGILSELRRVDAWSSSNDKGATRGGLSFTLLGDDGVRYYGSHLKAVSSSLEPATHIGAGAAIGAVGNTGNAQGTPCHLHFGISPPCPRHEWMVRRGAVYPQPFLDSWRKAGHDSPTAVIERWASANPNACAAAAAQPDAGES